MKRNKNFALAFIILELITASCSKPAEVKISSNSSSGTIQNETTWNDTNGNPIYAQGGNIMLYEGTYYWYGVQYGGSANFMYVNCYSSKDLSTWKWENHSLYSGQNPQLIASNWIGRLGVLYNSTSKQFVMIGQWWSASNAQPRNIPFVATCSSPTGEFTWQGSMNWPFSWTMGDNSIFEDSDGSAYLICVGDNGWNVNLNSTLKVISLSGDYLSLGTEIATPYMGGGQEAPNIFKYNGTYYLFSSQTKGWSSSETSYYTASTLSGPWTAQGIVPPYSSDSFNSQCDVVVPIKGSTTTTFIYMGDRWSDFTGNGIGYYVWCPLTFTSRGVPTINYFSTWRINTSSGAWAN